MASCAAPWQMPLGRDLVNHVPPASTLRLTEEPAHTNNALPLPMMNAPGAGPETADHVTRSVLEKVPHEVDAKAWLLAYATQETLQSPMALLLTRSQRL